MCFCHISSTGKPLGRIKGLGPKHEIVLTGGQMLRRGSLRHLSSLRNTDII